MCLALIKTFLLYTTYNYVPAKRRMEFCPILKQSYLSTIDFSFNRDRWRFIFYHAHICTVVR